MPSEDRTRAVAATGRALAALSAAVLVVAAASPGGAAEEGAPASAVDILHRAFVNRYGVDLVQLVHLRVRDRAGGEQQRRVQVAIKRIDGRVHSVGRFTQPEYLRGMTILTIERSSRRDDHFVYLPTLQRIRRITGAQRADPFMGTDLSYEDFEQRSVNDYDLDLLGKSSIGGEPVDVVVGRPRYDSGYERVRFFVAESDAAILETHYFKRGSRSPFKTIFAPRDGMVASDGHSLPTRIFVRNLARGTETEVRIERLRVNPELDDHLFTTTALETGRPIPLD